MMRAMRPSRGFTLVEALAAIAIMMIVIPVLMQGFMLASTIAENTRQTVDATTLAQSHLDELLYEMSALQSIDGVSAQDIVNNTMYNTTSEQDQYENELDSDEIVVTTAWLSKGTIHSVKLTTLVYIPENQTQTTAQTVGGLP
jgi:type II secretory pathway pseudopilin PulG